MPISFDFDSLDGIVIGKGTGSFSVEEVQRAAVEFWQRCSGPRYQVLWDLREVRFDLETGEVRKLAEFVSSRAPSGEIRTAYVVSGDLEFGFIRMFEVFRESEAVETHVFRDMQSAIDWLHQGDVPGE